MGKATIRKARSGGAQRTVLQRKHLIEKESARKQKKQNNKDRALQAQGLKKKSTMLWDFSQFEAPESAQPRQIQKEYRQQAEK